MKTQFKYVINIFLAFSNSYCGNRSITLNNKSLEKSNSTVSSNEVMRDDKQKNILEGAKQNLKEGAKYDSSMSYYVLRYKEGEYKNNEVYPGGDCDPKIGVCADVIIRSLRIAGIVDLQQALHEDIIINGRDYSLKTPDTNIDHRRVKNLEVWFSKYWNKEDKKSFLPGDIVIWDMNRDGASEHIGIVSDKKEGKRYFVIHNHKNPGHVAEEDKLFKWKITGHYRIK